MLINRFEELFNNKINIYIFLFLLILYYFYYILKKKNQSKRKNVYLNGISCCFPKNEYSQNTMKEMFIKNYCGGEKNLCEKDFQFIEKIFSKTLIEKCRINLSENRLFEQMNRENYTKYMKETMLSLSCQSANDLFIKLNCNPNEITHFIFGTMTASVCAPSLDIHIINKLKLNSKIKRLNVESMGCLTGFRLTGLSHDIVKENVNNIVLLIVCDIRSALGNQLTPYSSTECIDKSNVIISAMFRDACSATIFSQKSGSINDIRLIKHQSMIVPNSLDKVLLQEYNNGSIHLYLDKKLPDSLFDHLPIFIDEFLSSNKINIDQCLFALHTGGPRIINGVEKCLELKSEQLFATWFVMKNYGNLSGSSNLVVLEYLLSYRNSAFPNKMPGICYPSDLSKYFYVIGLSFGPGLGVECVIFHL